MGAQSWGGDAMQKAVLTDHSFQGDCLHLPKLLFVPLPPHWEESW